MSPRTSKKARKPLSRKSMKRAKGGLVVSGRVSGLAVDPSDPSGQTLRQITVIQNL